MRVWAGVLSAVLTMLGLSLFKASHLSAAATMLPVALSGFDPNRLTAVTRVAGVLILAVLGEGVRYLRRDVVKAPPKADPDRPCSGRLAVRSSGRETPCAGEEPRASVRGGRLAAVDPIPARVGTRLGPSNR